MSLLDLSNIPGYSEAVNQEQANRELAFLPMPPPICGVSVRHMNARHHILLLGCRNRFLCGGSPTPEDVAMFLWFLSPEYTTEPGFREAFVAERVRQLDFYQACRGIIQYMERVFQDWPMGDGVSRKQYTASIASLVDFVASEYGWSDEAILEMPLVRLFQYLRRIQMRHNPRSVMFNSTDRLLSKWMQERMTSPEPAPERN